MSFFQIRDLTPRPIRDVVFPFSNFQTLSTLAEKNWAPDKILEHKLGQLAVKEAELMIKGAVHLGLIAVGWFATSSLNWSSLGSTALGCSLSTSSMMIAGSLYGLSFGARSLLHCLGTGSLFQFTSGIGSIGVCYYILEKQETFQIGFLEGFINSAAEKVAPTLVKSFLSF